MKLPRRVFLHLILHLSTRKFHSDNRDHLYRWCARTRHPKAPHPGRRVASSWEEADITILCTDRLDVWPSTMRLVPSKLLIL
jgi:hypothetical protein